MPIYQASQYFVLSFRMDKKVFIDRLTSSGLIPVIRTESGDSARSLVDAIAIGGAASAEITMTIPDAVSLIEKLAAEMGNRIAIGAGTVCSAEDARRCIEAGAVFIVSPVTNVDVIEACKEAGVPVIAGALTPSEIFAASNAGADLVKVFPANALGGARYIRSVKAVFPYIQLIPTGGVTLENAADFIAAGAAAVGVGSDLADPRMMETHPKIISQNTVKFLNAIASVRESQL
jgi:2-dehydro-3-deoxyphosphogluconate aldolase/(4S)-4-hydroxy-2-oxoglutarate aldolase